ncbi:hypothetical protein [Xylanimonas protaetiae]|uniref:Uncharacterized protein n=1 Tax=Xylanimonas protaetiae TaxID=2509457 RepID=A0A4P6F3U9_9MICO|nr:hypothetical protein [Xylanimonas protaetiae]QAY69996.1 hypothetical protein ET471_08100 [Xylanimonas protaetiae]
MRYYDDREEEMRPLIAELATLVTDDGAAEMLAYGEVQLALEDYLAAAAQDRVPVPADLIERVRAIGEDLVRPDLVIRQAA